ncbi:MAG: hypothetical protein PHO37_00675 [Kiritimatiellae bacterium]|nr:hypothetical protein [Kiritimatiellia bacterium]
MNLTLKQLFKFGAVCVGVCALSASAVDYVSDSFEAGTVPGTILGSVDLPIGEYKQVTVGPQEVITNWFAASGDASKLVLTNAAYAAINGEGPISNETSTLMLQLETEGNTLSRAVTDVLDAFTTPVYIDTLIQFTPSEDEPVIDGTDVKVALYVNAASNLVVVSKKFIDLVEYFTEPATSTITLSNPIDPEKWYRLTMKVSGYEGFGFTEIWVDGQLITHANATDAIASAYNGSFFLNIDDGLSDINLISFQGTGSLDELVVSDQMPVFPDAPSIIVLTLVAEGGNVLFSPAGTANSGDLVTMTADDWFRIVSVTGPINEDLSGDLPAPNREFSSVLTATADCSVTVTVAQVSGPHEIGGTTFDLAKLSTWAIANTLGEGDVGASDIDDYLLNVPPTTDATIEITSIVVDKGAGTTTITVGASDPLVDFTELNGTLYVYTTTDLGVAFTLRATQSIDLVAGEAEVVISGLTNEFIKAIVE